MAPHFHTVQVYYEDTDHSGVVYHANYLKYFERAREHLLGVPELVRLYTEEGVGFVVVEARLRYVAGARFGDTLEVRTTVTSPSAWRATFQHDVHRPGTDGALVRGTVDLACVNREGRLVQVPEAVRRRIDGG